LVVTIGFKLISEFGATFGNDSTIDEDVHEVGADVTQDPRVVSDQQNSDLTVRGHSVDALGDYLESVNI
jgi:hypothetical protein